MEWNLVAAVMKFGKRKFLMVFALLTAGVTIIAAVALLHYGRFAMKRFSTVSNLGDVREAFFTYRDLHGEWPSQIDDVLDATLAEGRLEESLLNDSISGKRFKCVTTENVFAVDTNGVKWKVLVMLPESFSVRNGYRWHPETIVMVSDGTIRNVPVSRLIEN